MKLTFEQQVTTGKGLPKHPEAGDEESRLNIVVIFTSLDATIAALKTAGTLAEDLNARITLLVPIVVPYPLPLMRPPVPMDFQEKRFRDIAAECPAETQVQSYLCRDRLQTVKTVLRPHSLVVVGARKQWWPAREKNLARKLQDSGHQVIFTEANRSMVGLPYKRG
jgi:hypothetical protein